MDDEGREAQARGIEELDRRLAEPTRVPEDAAVALPGASPPAQLERLPLPATLDGRWVSHRAGIALFRNFPAGTEGEAT